jgi:hypothetical protein
MRDLEDVTLKDAPTDVFGANGTGPRSSDYDRHHLLTVSTAMIIGVHPLTERLTTATLVGMNFTDGRLYEKTP